MQPTLRRLLIE